MQLDLHVGLDLHVAPEEGVISKAIVCTWDMLFHLGRLPCLASMGEEVPNLTDTCSARVGGIPRGPHLLRRGREGNGLWEVVTRRGSSDQNVK